MFTLPQNKLKNIIIFLSIFIFGIFLSILPLQAYIAPGVYITELTLPSVNFKAGDIIAGSYSVWNSEENIVPDISQEFMIFIPDEEGNPKTEINNIFAKEKLLLFPGEKRSVNFSYQLPQNLLSGTYLFRITLRSGTGVLINWTDREINISANDKFLEISNPKVVKDETEFLPLIGVRFTSGDSPKIRFDISNPSLAEISAIPKILIFERQTNQNIVKEFEKESLTLSAGQKKTIDYEMPSLEKPESYLAELKFSDSLGNLISNSLLFRWVIEGEGAEILDIKSDQGSYLKGETANITINFVGPADGSQVGEGELLVEIYNEKGQISGEAKKIINLDEEDFISFNIPIERDTEKAMIKTTILKAGKILDQYQVNYPQTKEIPKKPLLLLYLLGGLTLLIIIFIIFKYFRKKKTTLLFLASLFLGILFLFNFNVQEAKAAVVEYSVGDLTLTWNLPQKDSYYNPGDYIVFLGSVLVTSCFDTIDEEGIIRFYLGTKQYPNNPAVLNDLGTKIGERPLIRGGQYYVGALKIPANFVGTPEGYAYARIYFTGRYADKYYAIIASERIRVNRPPTANAGPDKEVIEGQSVVLEGSGSDPDGDPITFSWLCTGGTLSNPNIAKPTYTAPLVTRNTTYTCTLTVTDNKGGRASDSMNVLVKDNRPPNKPGIPPAYPGGESWLHCGIQGLSIPTFHWTYSDPENDPQAAYQIKIYGETTLDQTVTCYVSPCLSYTPTSEWVRKNLNWGKTYSWQVRVKDNQGNWSSWSDLNSFTMPAHAYPWPAFDFSPRFPHQNESIQFCSVREEGICPTDLTIFYDTGVSWRWNFGDGSTATTPNPIHAYSLAGTYQVTLSVCDSDGYCCPASQTINITLPLPEWTEIPPF